MVPGLWISLRRDWKVTATLLSHGQNPPIAIEPPVYGRFFLVRHAIRSSVAWSIRLRIKVCFEAPRRDHFGRFSSVEERRVVDPESAVQSRGAVPIPAWCNGSTAASNSACQGSNPCAGANSSGRSRCLLE